MNDIDVAGYLTLRGGKPSYGQSGPQIVMDCPFCGKAGHLYVNVEEHTRFTRGKTIVVRPGDFFCFRCEQNGRFPRLWAELEGTTLHQARQELVRGALGASRRLPPVSIPPNIPAPAAKAGSDVRVELPPETIPIWDGERWRMPRYLLQRGIKPETARDWGLGYVTKGRYRNRIVLPINCPYGSSFTSRAVNPGARLRYLSGPGAGRLLFGWEKVEGEALVVVVEGPFDALAVYQAGFAAVAILGKRFRDSQLTMLRSLGSTVKIVLMLDADALDDALRQAPELGPNVLVGHLGAKDPGEASAGDIQHAIRTAISPFEALARRCRERLHVITQRD